MLRPYIYSGRANNWYFSRTTSTNACTASRSANSIQQWRTPSNNAPSRTACLMTRGNPFVALISCSSNPDNTNVPLKPDCMGCRAELPAPDLVHPDPFPGRAEVDDL